MFIHVVRDDPAHLPIHVLPPGFGKYNKVIFIKMIDWNVNTNNPDFMKNIDGITTDFVGVLYKDMKVIIGYKHGTKLADKVLQKLLGPAKV